MRGQIPATEIIKLEGSNEDQWRLLENGLINKLQISGLVKTEEKEVRIHMTITKVFSPKNNHSELRGSTKCNLGEEISGGINRIYHFANNLINKNCWLFIGTINGEEKKPILIIYYEILKMSFYTQQLVSEKAENFFPGLMLN